MKELTPFQIKTYNVVSFIPYGETRSYSWVAKRIGTSPRAIGKVLSVNPLPIIIPCHTRVKKTRRDWRIYRWQGAEREDIRD